MSGDALPFDADASPPTGLAQALGFGVYSIDLEGRCTYVNPAALEMLGYARDELLGRNVHDLIHHSYPDGSTYPQSACPLLAAGRTGRPVRLSNELLFRKDGSFFTAEYSAWPLVRDGAITGSVVTLVNSAEHGTASARLALQVTVARMLGGIADSDDLMPRLLAAMADGLGFGAAAFWTLSHRERQLTASAVWTGDPALAPLTAATEGLVLDRGVALPARAWEDAEIAHAAQIGPDRGLTDDWGGPVTALAIPARQGRRVLGVIELYARGAPALTDDLLDNAGAIGRQVGQYLRRKRAEDALRDREEEVRDLVENLPQLTFIADDSGAIEWVNRRWLDYAGRSQSGMTGWA